MRFRIVLFACVLTASTFGAGPAPAVPVVEEFSIPTSEADAFDIVAAPDGSVWFTERGPGQVGRVARIAPDGTITEYPVPAQNSSLHHPAALTIGPDCRPWFTNEGFAGIGRIAGDGSVSLIGPGAVGGTQAVYTGLAGIATGQDGALWLSETRPMYGDLVGRVAPSGTTGSVDGAGRPDDVASDGASLWVTERATHSIYRVFPGLQGPHPHFVLPSGWEPRGIVLGPDGAMWFTDSAGGRIGRAEVDGPGFTSFVVPAAGSRPVRITNGPDGALWFTDEGTNKIGRVTIDGQITEYAVPTADAGLRGITAGPDAVWFVEARANKIGRIPVSAAGTDVLAPETSARLDPDFPLPAWSPSSVTVTINANDRSGLGTVTYDSIGAEERSPVTVAPASNCADLPVTIEAEGTTVIRYRATDAVGNATDVRTRTVRIDRTGPETVMAPVHRIEPVSAGAVFSGTAFDAGSGVQAVWVRFESRLGEVREFQADCILGCGEKNMTWELHFPPLTLAPGQYTVSAYARDIAGTTGANTPPVRTLVI